MTVALTFKWYSYRLVNVNIQKTKLIFNIFSSSGKMKIGLNGHLFVYLKALEVGWDWLWHQNLSPKTWLCFPLETSARWLHIIYTWIKDDKRCFDFEFVAAATVSNFDTAFATPGLLVVKNKFMQIFVVCKVLYQSRSRNLDY